MKRKVIIGIDLAGSESKPTGWAKIEGCIVNACEIYENLDIIRKTLEEKPVLIAIDAPLSFPKSGIMRKADREMFKLGYPVFPPLFKSMKNLTKRGTELTRTLRDKGLKVIEVHPASTRKALGIPTKDWQKIQAIFLHIGLKGDLKKRTLTPHEIDAVTAALTAYLKLKSQTITVGEEKEGTIVVPIKQDWRQIKIE